MIIYDLSCAEGHRFEGWFASADDFARQAAAELVRCPLCNDAKIVIVPSARVAPDRSARDRGQAEREVATTSPPKPESAAVTAGLPPELLRKLREIGLPSVADVVASIEAALDDGVA